MQGINTHPGTSSVMWVWKSQTKKKKKKKKGTTERIRRAKGLLEDYGKGVAK